MNDSQKALQRKKIIHAITIAILVVLFIAFIFPFLMVVVNVFNSVPEITLFFTMFLFNKYRTLSNS